MSQTLANLVEVRGIRFSRGDRVIFDDISLSVPRVDHGDYGTIEGSVKDVAGSIGGQDPAG